MSNTEFASSDVGACRARRRRGYFRLEQVAGPSASSTGQRLQLFNDPKCRRWLIEAKRLVNERVIVVGLVSALESVKKDVNALKVGFQQSSIGTTLASAIFIAKQMGRCKPRMISIVAKLQDASKMQHNDTIVGIQIALTSKTDALLNLQFPAFWTLMKEPVSFLGSSLNGAAASKKKHSFITHLLKSNHFEIAMMPPEELALEVVIEKSTFVARHKSTQELERPRDYLHDAIHALEFEDPSKPCLDILSKPAGVLRASIVECCALAGQRWRGG